MLTPIYEVQFHEHSYGFRPNKCAQQAILTALDMMNDGNDWIVDIDLEKFFDTVNHDKLMTIVGRTIKDGDVISIVRKYLVSGIMIDNEYEDSIVGTPQGGNLSPLLANIMLNELDKEMEKRGLNFVRYADDCIIMVGSEMSANRVMRNISRFIEEKLGLKVNTTKSKVDRPNGLKYLGFGFYFDSRAHQYRTFKGLYDKISDIGINTLIADAGYKTPAIAKLLLDDGIKPLFPYKSPMTKDGFFKKSDFVYDEYYDYVICPNDQHLEYSTTNKDGYREYKSNGHICKGCPYLSQCTNSQNHVKVFTRHIWEDYMETCEDIRHTLGMKDLYKKRKETIERLFGTAKENHGFRYTQMYGKARMEMKVGMTFACLNLKKLARILNKRGIINSPNKPFFTKYSFSY